ncbi:MAG: hypothetical protein K9I35_07255 [Flavobacterium sp.]|nr:hypothetical protein [Flavobacterium sp.]
MNIIISPIYESFFSGRIWMGVDIERIKQYLIEINSNFNVQIIDFSIIANDYSLIPKNAFLFYTASYNDNYLQYIKDIILDISFSRPDIVLLPNLDQLFSFENKGYQELVKKRVNIENVRGKYIGDLYEEDNFRSIFQFPIVLKTLKGAMSSGVQLIENKQQLIEYDSNNKKLSFKEYLIFKKRVWNKTNQSNSDFLNLAPNLNLSLLNFNKFFSKRNPFVIQDFIPDLECDYKVLIFGIKFFVFKRGIRENDFRASGSGKFTWVKPPDEVLEFALDIQKKFKSPFISLDIGFGLNKNVYLFEFQGIGFGPIGLTKSNSYFIKLGQTWNEIKEKSNLEREYSSAINYHINKQNENY